MSVFNNISYKNIVRRPGRTFILIILSALLCFSVTGGSLAITSLKGGLLSLKSRLGADVMVVPYEATTKTNFSNMILQGNPGYFYMDRSVLDKIKKIETFLDEGKINFEEYKYFYCYIESDSI